MPSADGYQPYVYREQGGSALVINAGAGGVLKGQSSTMSSPAQAATVAAATAATGVTTGIVDIINGMRTALINIGVLAT